MDHQDPAVRHPEPLPLSGTGAPLLDAQNGHGKVLALSLEAL